MKKGMTLVEILIALVMLGIVMTVVGALVKFSANSYFRVQKEIMESSSQGMRFFDTVAHRVMRAKKTAISDAGKTLTIYSRDISTGQNKESVVTLAGDKLMYYPDGVDAQGQLLATGVKNVAFTHDYQMTREWVVGNPVPDGLWAPVYYYSAKGPERVAVELEIGNKTMRTAAVPRLASPTKERVEWLSPMVIGELKRIEEKSGHTYAVVSATAVAMHTPAGFMDVKNTDVYVDMPLKTAFLIKRHAGKEIAFMGDVIARDADGNFAMRMNPAYGGGYLLKAEEIVSARERIEAGKEDWYKVQTARLESLFKEARQEGVDLGQWDAAWGYLKARAAQ